MACVGLAVAFLVVHSYSIEEDAISDSGLADGLAVATGLCTVAAGLVAVVALAGFEQPMHSGAVLDTVLAGVTGSVYCPVH